VDDPQAPRSASVAAPPPAAAPTPAAPTRVPDVRRGMRLFLLVAFGVAWALWGLAALAGGLGNPLAVLLLVVSMYAPTLGTLAARRWADPDALRVTGLRHHGPWRWYLLVYVLIPALLLAGAALSVLLGIQHFDPTLGVLREMLQANADRAGLPPPELPSLGRAILLSVPVLLVAPLFNTLAAIGEEIGWRGYLLARLQPLGPRRAAVAVGAIWGVWHAPIIAMGHNYPGEPLLGPPLMVVFTVVYGVIFAWLRLRSGSVWVAGLAHGAVNAEAGLTVIFLTRASPLVGTPIGWVTLIPAALVALALFRFGRWDLPPSDESRVAPLAPGADFRGAELA
jgi:uncharacterized protein